jgi:hypothetical protein
LNEKLKKIEDIEGCKFLYLQNSFKKKKKKKTLTSCKNEKT